MNPPIVTRECHLQASHYRTHSHSSLPHRLRVACVALLLAFAGVRAYPQHTQNAWAWFWGSKDANDAQSGVYGIRGVADAANSPGARQGSVLWADAAGDIWMFGGFGGDGSGINGYLNDLWKYDPVGDRWTWISGVSALPGWGGTAPAVYGYLGHADSTNVPGGRSSAAGWVGKDGNLWLFGGVRPAGSGMFVYLNDLWEFDISTLEWTWRGGSPDGPAVGNGASGVYGTLGVAAAGNTPGGKGNAAACQGQDGRVWLFGGSGVDGAGKVSYALNDLWTLDPVSRQWTWMGGYSSLPSSGNYFGVYGTLGVAAPENFPGARMSANCWVDHSDDVWIFGGFGYTGSDSGGHGNDLWRFEPSAREWTWMGGSSNITHRDPGPGELIDFHGQPGVYGSLRVASTANIPGGRSGAAAWTDEDGNLWLHGGTGFDASGHFGSLDDLWKLVPASLQWEWFGGHTTVPPCSSEDYSVDPCGYLGIYGMYRRYVDSVLQPGSRTNASSATDGDRHLWMFGGNGYDARNNFSHRLNDLWEFQLATSAETAAPTFSPLGGTYVTCQNITLSDATPGATIYYTSDGTSPTIHSSVYAGPIAVCPANGIVLDAPSLLSMAINAIAVAPGFGQSQQSWEFYTVDLRKPDRPVFNPPPGAYSGYVDVTLFEDSYGAQIYYTLDGRVPDRSSTPYTAPIHLTSNTTVWAIACKPNVCGEALGAAYDVAGPAAALPTFNPPGGPYAAIQSVVISDSTPGATIFYTTDGTHPTTSSSQYTGPITISASQTIAAIATAAGYSASAIASAEYTISLPPPSFTLSASPSAITIHSGSEANVTVRLAPVNGFDSATVFACSGMPTGVSCLFSPATVTPSGGTTATTLLTISTGKTVSAQNRSGPWLPSGALFVAGLLYWLSPRRKARLWMSVLAGCLLLLTGCGGHSSRTPLSAAVTITGTAGSLQQSTTITLTVE